MIFALAGMQAAERRSHVKTKCDKLLVARPSGAAGHGGDYAVGCARPHDPASGRRFLIPTNSPGGGRAFAEKIESPLSMCLRLGKKPVNFFPTRPRFVRFSADLLKVLSALGIRIGRFRKQIVEAPSDASLMTHPLGLLTPRADSLGGSITRWADPCHNGNRQSTRARRPASVRDTHATLVGLAYHQMGPGGGGGISGRSCSISVP